LLDLVRRYRDASKRSIDRERSLESGDYSGDAIDPCPTPGSLFMARESVSALRSALSRLPDDEQAVIVLRHFESLCFQEVGHRLHRSPEAARKLWSRAIVRLQRLLEVTPGDG
jgi:RNA polymerase sigma-70 factor (ECF subfamily)